MARFKFKFQFACQISLFPSKLQTVYQIHTTTHTRNLPLHTHTGKKHKEDDPRKKKAKNKKLSLNNDVCSKVHNIKGLANFLLFKCTKICKMPLTLYSFRLSKLQNGHIYCLLIFSVSTSPLERNFNSYLNQISLFLFLQLSKVILSNLASISID